MAKQNNKVPDDKDIYLAFSTVFAGQNAQVRRPSVIKKLVHHSEKRPEVAQFFKKNNHNALRPAVYERLRVLLEQQVFQSYRYAKVKFPDLFATSAAQSAKRAASEVEAANDHARAIEGALQSDQEGVDDKTDDSDETCTQLDVPHSDNSSVSPAQACPTAPALSSGPPVPALFPMRFQFITGHKIISEVQTTLEQACFDFARHALPEVLQKEGWDCSEAVELNNWVRVFRKHQLRIFPAVSPDSEVDKKFWKSLCDIRHTAVHRLSVTAASIETCLRDGERLATLLEDEAAADRLSTMRCELQRVTAEMENHKCMLEAKLIRTRERIAAERDELDRQEKEAIDSMVQADKEYQLSAGASLEQKFATRDADVVTESEESSDEDTEDRLEEEGESDGKTVKYFGGFDHLFIEKASRWYDSRNMGVRLGFM